MAKTLLLITQVYVPDPAAVGQHMADAAEAMVERGWRVVVLTANRGYDNPQERYPGREKRRGVEIVRLPWSSLGKRTILHRLAGQLAFCVQALVRGLCLRHLDGVLVTTSPPMGSVLAWVLRGLRGTPYVFWAMDINPDQAVALGKARAGSLPVRVFDWANGRVLAQAHTVVTLDRYMTATLARKHAAVRAKTIEMPPWPMEGYLERIPHEANPFRQEHGLAGKCVIMYSGNHSLAHPLRTLLVAAQRVADDPRLVFLFVGGGHGKQEVDALIAAQRPANIRSLPYQPLDRIKYSLSAADVHVVSMGPAMVGLVHPCKFYGAMALGKPVLLLGPSACHVGDLMAAHDFGWAVEHGDVDAAERLLRSLPDRPPAELETIGARGREVVASELSQQILCARFCDVLARLADERTTAPQPPVKTR